MKFITAVFLLFMIFASSHAQNYVTTYAGDGTNGYADGDTAACKFKGPFGMCIDHLNNLYIADNTNHRIRKISSDGIVSTLAGTGIAGYADGPDSSAQFNAPSDLCADAAGNIYVSDFQNQYIRKISIDGMVSTIAGNGIAGYVDGSPGTAEFNYPRGICIDAQGNLFIADSWNHRIRRIDAGGNVSTLAGNSDTIGVQSPGDFADGNDTAARFNVPCGMSIDSAGNLYLADAYNHRIRKITNGGIVTTIAGSGAIGAANGGFLDGDTSMALLNTPTEVFFDNKEGKIFIADSYNNRIRMLQNNNVSTVAGNGSSGFENGIDTASSFRTPRGIVTGTSGNHVYVCDNGNHVIRKISLSINTGLELIQTQQDFRLFPNPASGMVWVSSMGRSGAIYISDIFGKQVFFSESECEISPCMAMVNSLPDGMYVVTVVSENGRLATEKLMIAR
ncbi:MAG: SMP-30/gluconolactonase/LRE family protein [Chitinophagales bacterium]